MDPQHETGLSDGESGPGDGESGPADGESGPADGESGPGRPGASAGWPGAPATVRVVAVLAVIEAVGLAALGGWGLTQLLAGTEPNLGGGLFLVLFAFAVAAMLVVSARALLAGRRSGRAPVATWQLLQGATAFALGSATGLVAAWVVLAVSAGVFVLLMTRRVVEHTVGAAAGGRDGAAGTGGPGTNGPVEREEH